MDGSWPGHRHDSDSARPDGAPVSRLSLPAAQPPGGRRVMRTGTCIALIVIGAILAFAVTGGSSRLLNLQVVGVILILAGILGLVLSLLVWGPLNPARRRRDQLSGFESGPPQVVEEHRVYQDQPQVVEEHRVYRDQPPL
jgi:hypothetical protein